ncbi:hypothetical protein V1524DRAFT_443951 [Lipomyces starkeyi]
MGYHDPIFHTVWVFVSRLAGCVQITMGYSGCTGYCLFTSLFWFPRSPRWLASKDRWEEVLRLLAFLRTPKCDINDPLVLAEYKEIC